MKVNHWGRARQFIKLNKNAEEPLTHWKKAVTDADWKKPSDIGTTFASVSRYKEALIINIGGNNYRLVAVCSYELATLYIDKIMSHQEYDENKWRDRYDKKKQ